MGRYDSRIKVYDNGQWKNVQRLRIKDYKSTGGYCDLGTNTSSNSIELYVKKNGSFIRATRHLNKVSYVDDIYTIGTDNGAFHLLPVNGFCFCPNGTSSSMDTAWEFSCYMKRTSTGDKNVFTVTNGTRFIKITWLNNGKIQVKAHYGSDETLTTTVAQDTLDVWYYLKVSQAKGSNTMNINWGGTNKTGSMYQNFLVGNSTNTVGASGLKFSSTLTCKGCKYTSNTTSTKYSINTDMSTNSGNGSKYKNAKLEEHYVTFEEWV